MQVAAGETFEVQTQLNRGPWLDAHPEGERLRALLRGGNPSSGCVEVTGAKAGQMLSVAIGPIALDPLGFTNYRGSNGAMPGWMGHSGIGPQHKIVTIRDGKFRWDERLELAVRPMIGFVGVSSPYETFANTWCTRYGGNFDVQEITTGAVVHLPIGVDGARLHIGDMHAIQGDGEICGAGGIEASGVVQVTPGVRDLPPSMTWPRITNATHLMVATQARPAEDAFRIGLEEMVKWLAEDYGFTPGDAYLYLGQVLEARVTQFVNPTFTYLLKVARKHLPAGALEW
jgi:acetamidase/formamidase